MRPRNPEFSSGPCKKRPGYNLSNLRIDSLGRSHRSKLGKARLKKSLEDTKRILGIPDDYLVGIVPASDTGAYEVRLVDRTQPTHVSLCSYYTFLLISFHTHLSVCVVVFTILFSTTHPLNTLSQHTLLTHTLSQHTLSQHTSLTHSLYTPD